MAGVAQQIEHQPTNQMVAGQKELAQNIQSDEKQGPTTKITLPSKAIIQNGRTDKVLPRQGNAKRVHHHQAILYEMIKRLI